MFQEKMRKSEASQLGTMGYVDAHIHLADPGYAGKVEEMIQDAAQHNVSQMLSNAVDYETSLETIKIAKSSSGRVLAAVGIHPSATLKRDDLHLDEFEKMVDENADSISAIGEIGLDGKYSQDERIKTKQKELFHFFLALAEEKSLPVVVHSRQAVSETIDFLARFRLPSVLLHWYDGPTDSLSTLKDRRYMISIGPAVLYSRKIAEIARAVNDDLILTETDGPVAYRGLFGKELTKPSFVVDVVKRLAEIRGSESDAMRSIVFSNFQRFLSIN
jgi:TatD DNase family protein